jgi:hypothetical protein
MPRMTHRFTRLLPLAGAVMAFTAGPCEERSADCAAEPLGELVAFSASAQAPPLVEVDGTLTEYSPAGDGYSRLVVQPVSGPPDTLRVSVPDDLLRLEIGQAYAFRVEHVGGRPPASGLVISDQEGLVFAGATDGTIGGHVLKDGLPGFEFELVDGGCESRDRSTCFDAIVNRRLDVRGGANETVSLFNGDSGRIGTFQVTCLTAQHVDYSSQCADAGLPAVSWVVARVNSAGAPP